MDPFVAEECFSALLVRDKYELYKQFDKREVRCCLVRLFMGWYKAHVSIHDLNEGCHVPMVSNDDRVSRCVFLHRKYQDYQK